MGKCLAHSQHPQMLCYDVAPNLQTETCTKCQNPNLVLKQFGRRLGGK